MAAPSTISESGAASHIERHYQPQPAAEPSRSAKASKQNSDLAPTLGIVPWQVGPAGIGHDPRSAYVETFWLPLLGPSTVMLMRRLAAEFDHSPNGFEIPTDLLSKDIGLGNRMSRRSAFARTLDRCASFHLLLIEGPIVHVRRHMSTLSPRQIEALSPRLKPRHQAWATEIADEGLARRSELLRVAHLARTLLELGETPEATERQLSQWGSSPAMAWHALHWARSGELDEPSSLAVTS